MKQRHLFTNDAIFGLPWRIIIGLIIGVAVLTAILSYIFNPCLFPSKMIITIDPMIAQTTPGENWSLNNFTVTVTDQDGVPIEGASIIMRGLTSSGSNTTDHKGITVVQINATLEPGVYEGYMDITVKATCHETYQQIDAVKIVRQ